MTMIGYTELTSPPGWVVCTLNGNIKDKRGKRAGKAQSYALYDNGDEAAEAAKRIAAKLKRRYVGYVK